MARLLTLAIAIGVSLYFSASAQSQFTIKINTGEDVCVDKHPDITDRDRCPDLTTLRCPRYFPCIQEYVPGEPEPDYICADEQDEPVAMELNVFNTVASEIRHKAPQGGFGWQVNSSSYVLCYSVSVCSCYYYPIQEDFFCDAFLTQDVVLLQYDIDPIECLP